MSITARTAVSDFKRAIVSRCTARVVLQGTAGSRVLAPVDFRCAEDHFEVSRDGFNTFWRGQRLPYGVLADCAERNVAYLLEDSVPGSSSFSSSLGATLLLEELEDGTLLKVAEPREEKVLCVGPVLYVNRMKMHVSNGFSDTRSFSRLLARSSVSYVSKEPTTAGECVLPLAGLRVLDLFYGLGISTAEALRLGAEQVVAFERPQYGPALRRMINCLKSASPDLLGSDSGLDDARLLYRLCDLNTVPSDCDIFSILAKDAGERPFDAVILDPPKRATIFRRIYHPIFLDRLAAHLRPGAVVACYAPTVNYPPWKRNSEAPWTAQFLPSFESTNKYTLLNCEEALHKHIVRFHRV